MPPLPRTPCTLRSRRPGQRARGFVLIEALVSIVLFLVGVLGILGLQAGMARSQTESQFRSEAAYLAQELLGLMWADVPNLASGGFTISDSGDDCTATACQRWLEKTRTTLPSGSATIAVAAIADGSVGSDVDITVTWTMPSGEARRYITSSTIATSHTP